MSLSTTEAPSSAMAKAQARPNPWAAPVTSATFPASFPVWLTVNLPAVSCCSAQDERIGRLSAGIDPDRFGLEIGIDRFLPAFPADAAALIAAEGRHEADGAIAVDPDRAGLDALRHAYGAPDIRGPYARRQPIGAVISDCERLVFILEGNDGEDRAEHFFPRDSHAVGNPGEDR